MFKLKTTFIATISKKQNSVINIKALRIKNLPYIYIWIIYYAWVIVFTTWWTAAPATDEVFGLSSRNLLHSISLISATLFLFILRKEWFVKSARTGAVFLVVGIGLFLMIPSSPAIPVIVPMIGIAIGVVNVSSLVPFVFALNNTEKFYSIVASNILINILLIFRYGFHDPQGSIERIVSMAVLAAAISAVLFFKKSVVINEPDHKEIVIPEFNPRIYLTLVYNCAIIILCKGASTGVFDVTAGNYGNSVYLWYYIGGLAGCFIYFAVYTFTSKPFIWLGNITFSGIAMGLLCNAFADGIYGMAVLFAILLGIGSTVGMINLYYIIAVVGKKYNSMHYLRLSLLFIGLCGGISGVVVGNLISGSNSTWLTLAASLIAVAFMLVFLATSPVMAQEQYYTQWARDSEKVDIDNGEDNMFGKYKLTKRETEVCRLLLEGYTLRQISAELSIAYPTVNTHCTSAYRKLKINSRTELLILFKDYTTNQHTNA